MRLSEAIRLGSLAIQNPKQADTRFCAIGMGLECIGKRHMGRDGGDFDAANYQELFRAWPWVKMRAPRSNEYWMKIFSLFDDKVCPRYDEPTMTLEALCDIVSGWERGLESDGINVEQVTMAATPETTLEPDSEHTEIGVL